MKCTIVEQYLYPLPLPNFDDLWYIILKLLTEKGDHVTSQGVVHITVITRLQLVLFSTELTRVVIG